MESILFDAGEPERKQIFEQIRRILEEFDAVAFAYLYGSFSEGRRFHDIDVGVYLNQSHLDVGDRIEDALFKRLQSEVSYPFDVRVLNDAPAAFLFHVLRGDLASSRDSELHGRVFERTVARYLDMAPRLKRASLEAFG